MTVQLGPRAFTHSLSAAVTTPTGGAARAPFGPRGPCGVLLDHVRCRIVTVTYVTTETLIHFRYEIHFGMRHSGHTLVAVSLLVVAVGGLIDDHPLGPLGAALDFWAVPSVALSVLFRAAQFAVLLVEEGAFALSHLETAAALSAADGPFAPVSPDGFGVHDRSRRKTARIVGASPLLALVPDTGLTSKRRSRVRA